MVEVNEALYTNIPNPKELRRDVLLLTIDAIRLIKREQYMKILKKEKFESMKELKVILKELNSEINHLNKDFPAIKVPKREEKKRGIPGIEEISVKEEKKLKHEGKKVVHIHVEKHKEIPKDPLERELEDIQSRLGNI